MAALTSTARWQVLMLFLIPVGGGIPPGVLLAKARGLPWPETALLYFISDVILAFIFEPLMLAAIAAGRRVALLSRAAAAVKASIDNTAALWGRSSGPITLILISFGVDPMTGRSAASAAGHGFVSGWTLAIIGDMMYFAVIMACTLWLRSVLGDGTVVTFIMLAAMIAVPAAVRRWRERRVRGR